MSVPFRNINTCIKEIRKGNNMIEIKWQFYSLRILSFICLVYPIIDQKLLKKINVFFLPAFSIYNCLSAIKEKECVINIT